MRALKVSQLLLCGLTVLSLSGVVAAAPTMYGPTPYLSFADSPFTGAGLSYFYLEDFEDGLLNTPGVIPTAGFPTKPTFPAIITDSVDADDGVIDGNGNGGNSWFSPNGGAGVMFVFNPVVLGSFPTQAGIVWTDGLDPLVFIAFDATMAPLGVIGPVAAADGVFTGTTAEDRFFGVSNPGGIGAILIMSGPNGGIEVDHLQYGGTPIIPAPGALLLGGIGAGVIGWMRRRKMM